MGTKIKPGDFDCYANAEPDEPMFILLARDSKSPALVEAWADKAEAAGKKPEKVAEARQCAAAMRSWRAANVFAVGDRFTDNIVFTDTITKIEGDTITMSRVGDPGLEEHVMRSDSLREWLKEGMVTRVGSTRAAASSRSYVRWGHCAYRDPEEGAWSGAFLSRAEAIADGAATYGKSTFWIQSGLLLSDGTRTVLRRTL